MSQTAAAAAAPPQAEVDGGFLEERLPAWWRCWDPDGRGVRALLWPLSLAPWDPCRFRIRLRCWDPDGGKGEGGRRRVRGTGGDGDGMGRHGQKGKWGDGGGCRLGVRGEERGVTKVKRCVGGETSWGWGLEEVTEEGLPPAGLRSATSGNSTLMNIAVQPSSAFGRRSMVGLSSDSKGASQRLRPREATDGGTHSWSLGALSGLAAARAAACRSLERRHVSAPQRGN